MIRSYFVTAFRFLLQNKTYSLINIIGLAIGTLSCLYILLYVQDQYSYDKHHKGADDIYRITSQLKVKGDSRNFATSSPPIAPALKNDFPQVSAFTRLVPILGVNKSLITYKDKALYESNAFYADSTFFDVFSYHFIAGNAHQALTAPFSIVLFKSVADKIFGKEDPLNKLVTFNFSSEKHTYRVTGVIDETAGKSHINAGILLSLNSGAMGEYISGNKVWAGNNFTFSYIKLRPGASAENLEKQFPAFLNKYGGQELKQLGMEKRLHLQPVSTIHTTTGYDAEMSKTISPSFLYTLVLIALLIQVTACINFMNLSTARASKRAKEVGVRKVIGASKADLIRQFIGESFLISFISVIIAVPLLALALPYLNSITQANIHLVLIDYRLWLLLTAMIVVTGLLAGSYPAFYLSAFKVIKVLKGNLGNHTSAAGLRRSLVIFQFVVSVVLITGIIVIYFQLNYIKNKDLGFSPNQKLIFNFYTRDMQNQMNGFTNDLRQLSEVNEVSKANTSFGLDIMRDHGVYLAGGSMPNAIDAQNLSTDEHFTAASGIKLISGRNFISTDTGKVLINETLARRLGLDVQKASGVRLYSQYQPAPVTFVEVVGVVKDFNYSSLHGEIKPFMLMYAPLEDDLNTLLVAVNSKDYGSLLKKMAVVWHKNLPSSPFEYKFLDDQVQQQYEAEITLSHIINSFTLVAIFISCMGLFGLAAFSAEQRFKEIGIRKVLGASEASIVKLLSADFLKLIAVAIIIAVPISWWAMGQWLQAFVYRISISWWMFALSGITAISIALLTVAFQAIKAAVINPVKSLRSE